MSRRFLLFCVAWIAAGPAYAAGGSPLEARVQAYWGAQQQGHLDEASAMVIPASRPRFMKRPSLPVAAWSVDKIRETGDRAGVSLKVKFGGVSGNRTLPGRVEQVWRRIDGEWYLQVPDATPAQFNRLVYGRSGPAAVRPGILSAEPSRLVLHFLNPVQQGVVAVANGRERTAVLVDCSSSSKDLAVHFDVDRIEPGKRARLIVRYQGTQIE